MGKKEVSGEREIEMTIEEAKANLIEAGKKSGEFTLDEVTEKLSPFEMEPEQFEEFLDLIEAQGIEMDRKAEAKKDEDTQKAEQKKHLI